jgi:hypothetical protein
MMKKPLKPGEKRERKTNKMMIKLFVGMLILITILIIWDPVAASNNNNVTNNYYPASMTIIEGISDKDLAEGLAGAMAAGAHQFDFSTSDWQGSVTGSKQLSDEEEGNVSFAVGKRFKENFMPNVLVHFTYTPIGSDDWVVVGGTFRF